MRSRADLAAQLGALREAFDASFAASLPGAPPPEEHLLAVRAGGAHLAVRVEDLAGVQQARQVTPLPGGAPGLLGLAGIRGRLLAVHDLGLLLGALGALRAREVGRQARWLLLPREDQSLALGVDALEGYLVRPVEAPGAARAADVIEHAGLLRGVLDVGAMVALARRHAQDTR